MYNMAHFQYSNLYGHYNKQTEKYMANFYPFLIYVFVTTFTPGPNNIVSMSNGMRYGYKKILKFLGGIFAGFFVVMLLCGLLNIVLISLLPQVKIWLNILGAAYMIYLAFHIVFSKPVEEASSEKGLNSFKAGFGMQFLNVKVILYGITVFSTFIIKSYQDPVRMSGFALLLAAIGFISTSCWAVGGDLFRNLVRKYSLVFNLAMGGLLVYTAIASLL
jgi:cysteine/O-acetylserine efflux protein